MAIHDVRVSREALADDVATVAAILPMRREPKWIRDQLGA